MGNKKPKKHNGKNINVRIKNEDFERLKQGFANSTCWTMTDYCRKLLTGKPVTVFYRDQSLDVFIDEAIMIRKTLQNVEKGNAHLTPLINEIKNCINNIYDYVRQNKT